ncbi:hypothetical protein GCM10010515_74090 [Streptomyces fructofermentans]|uniref:Uncharacterized protein n=1 Tax=Streptomyces fructofermentans TaxID=152141 RepID=A0A918NUM8_9ACTN|nr:hypothetical protein GCM10010515_74090 [Streptomyces fructofermentans]
MVRTFLAWRTESDRDVDRSASFGRGLLGPGDPWKSEEESDLAMGMCGEVHLRTELSRPTRHLGYFRNIHVLKESQ